MSEQIEQLTDKNQFNIENRRSDGSYYNLQKMNQLHHEIVRRIVVGQKDSEIAAALGCTTATVKYTRESPVVKQKLEIMMGARDASAVEIRKRIQNLAPLALHRLEEIMEDDTASESVRMKIAQDLLDRAGYDPVKKTMDVGKYNEERINEIKQRARQNGMTLSKEDDKDVEDAEIVEENESGEGSND